MLIRSQEIGLLPSAPEFSEAGTWPPVATDWLPLRWELFDAQTSSLAAYAAYLTIVRSNEKNNNNILLEEDAFRSDSLYESAFSQNSIAVQNRETTIGDEELRRLLHAVRWERKDPVIQLPPDSTHEMMHSVTTGLSIEHSQTLAKSLGMSIGGNLTGLQTKLSSQLDQEFGFKLNITAQEERSTKLTLANHSDGHYRLFALWHVDHRITVDALELPLREEPPRFTRGGRMISLNGLQPMWAPRGAVEFVMSNEPFITYTEINRS